jgi:hypothetical protein
MFLPDKREVKIKGMKIYDKYAFGASAPCPGRDKMLVERKTGLPAMQAKEELGSFSTVA